jgi:thiol-disulfide isomerase/thioredoxin
MNSQQRSVTPLTPSPVPTSTCQMSGINALLTYILIFFLVLLVCYTIVYVYRMYANPTKKTESFADEVSRDKIVGCFMTNCPHCVRFKPAFEGIAASLNAKSGFEKEWSITSTDDTELAAKEYGVHSFPTVVVIKNGSEVDRAVGSMTGDKFRAFLRPHVGNWV